MARTSGALGARVGLAESSRLGGTCVNVGCIPKKLFVYASHVHHELADAAGYGWSIPEPSFDWAALRENKDREIERLNGIYRGLLEKTGVEIHVGAAELLSPHEVRVGGRVRTAERVVLANGAQPKRPEIPGAELGLVSDDCFVLPKLPRSIIVVGSGYIGLEFATVFAGLGVETTVLARSRRVLTHFDKDIAHVLEREIRRQEIRLETDVGVDALRKVGDQIEASSQSGRSWRAEAVLFAVGRTANLSGIDTRKLGISMTPAAAIHIDDDYQTTLPGVYAIGDITSRIQLTPVALAEGTALAQTFFGGRGKVRVDYLDIPTAVFTIPEVSCVGMTEAHAQAHHSIRVYESDFRPLKQTLSPRGERMYMKLIVDEPSDRVLGVHVVGSAGAEIVQGLAVAIKAGVTKAHLDATMGIHPTSAEELVTMRTPRAAGAADA